MKIDAKAALTLAAFIRSDLTVIARIENRVSQFDVNNLSPAELDSLGYSMHNIQRLGELLYSDFSEL